MLMEYFQLFLEIFRNMRAVFLATGIRRQIFETDFSCTLNP